MSAETNTTMTGDTKLPVVDDDGLLVTAAAAATVETGSGHGERRDVCSASQAIDPEAEKRLVWKFDLRILPVLAIMYLFNALVSSSFLFFSFVSGLGLPAFSNPCLGGGIVECPSRQNKN